MSWDMFPLVEITLEILNILDAIVLGFMTDMVVWIDRKLEDHCTFITTEEREKRLLAMVKLKEYTRKKPKTLIGSQTESYNKAFDNNVIEDRKKSNEISQMKN